MGEETKVWFCESHHPDGRPCYRNVHHVGKHLSIKADGGGMELWGDTHTSEEWCKITGVKVLDPDGWNRRNLSDSWAEHITQEEFTHRVVNSTVDMRGAL